MARRYYDLPSLTTLGIFEAVARHASLKLAGEELNVTSGAISRQIRAIETELGTTLFRRTGRGMALTPAGEELRTAVSSSFSRMADVARGIRMKDRSRNVMLVSSETSASMWLVPRMPAFWRNHPDIMIDHVVAENDRSFRPEEMDLRFRYGSGEWVNESGEFLFGDIVYPVCSPGFAEKHRDVTAGDLRNLPLIDIHWVASDWMSWEETLMRSGLPAHPVASRRYGKFNLAMQASIAGQGVALGWHRMIAPLLQRGELVRFTELTVPSPGSYHLTWHKSRTLSSAASTLRDWIVEQATAERLQAGPIVRGTYRV